jgi:hypothetical protein
MYPSVLSFIYCRLALWAVVECWLGASAPLLY